MRNLPAVSTRRGTTVAHVFAFDVGEEESFPPPDVPGHLEWVPLAEAIALLAPVIPDHVGYCEAVRKAALPRPRRGSQRSAGPGRRRRRLRCSWRGAAKTGSSRPTLAAARTGVRAARHVHAEDGGPGEGAGPSGGKARCSYCSCSNVRYLLYIDGGELLQHISGWLKGRRARSGASSWGHGTANNWR